jgi:PRTRC genetic system protein E
MFTQIQTMLAEGETLAMTVTALKDGRLSLVMLPKGEFSKTPALGAGLSLSASAAELDSELAELLAAYASKRATLKEQLEAAALVLEQAGKEATAKAAQKSAAPSAKATQNKIGVKSPPQDLSDSDGEEAEDEEGENEADASIKPVTPTVTPKESGKAQEPAEVSLF